MNEYSKTFLEKTIKVWQPFYENKLSLDEAKEIIINMTSLIKLLNELENKNGS